MEIALKSIKSVGQHLIIPYQDVYDKFGNGVFDNCLSPNEISNGKTKSTTRNEL